MARVASAAGGGGNASINLTKTIGAVAVTPTLGLGLTVDKPAAIPGDTLTYTATLTNTGANLKLTGTFVAQNSSTAATVAADYDYVEYFSIQASAWVPLAGAAASQAGYTPVETAPITTGLSLAATGRPTAGVTYGSGADHIVGTAIGGSKTATWDYTATILLSPTQLALLLDPAKVSKIRNVVHFEVTPRAPSVGQPFTFRVDFINQLRAGNGTVTNATITITPPSGAPAVFNKTTNPTLASIPSGAVRTVQSTYVVPAVAPKGASETDVDYVARLRTFDGRTLTAKGDASGTGGGVTITAPQQTVTATERLPILSIDKSGPATVDAGTTITYDVALANSGSAPASGLVITDALPGGATGTVSDVPASIAPAGSATAHAAYNVPTTQPEGPLADTAAVTWKDANGNVYGPLSDSFTTQVQNSLAGAHLVLSPATAGPLVVGSEHTLAATLTDRNDVPVAGQSVHFAVTGPNSTSGNATTNASGVATFTYQGDNAGTDQAQATATKNATTVQSNTASASWIALVQPVSITNVHGNFYTNTGVAHFTATPASTPVFGQDFPTIDFNPPAGTVLNNISSVDTTTRPFTDLTTDINGNFTGSIVAEGNGHQAGVADLTHFDAVFSGSFVATQASDVTFNVFSDAGFILGVGGGASRVSGAFENPPASGTTPFQAFPVVGAFNLDSAPAAHPVTIHFPAPGSYPFEIDYFECCDSQLSLTLTTVSFIGDTSPLSLYVGYADGLRPGGSVFPFPWKGAPGVTFIGDNGTYDAGALRFDNSSDAPIVLDSAIVEIAGVRHDIWGRNLTVPAHGTLITTQTIQFNFDTSDDRGATCTPIGTIPHVLVTIGGVTTTYNDTSQILNTRDIDLAACPGGPNESHAWERIGGGGTPVNHALPPAAALAIDPNTANGTVGLGQSFTITAMDASGHPVADLPVNVQVFGVNTRTLTGTTDSAGIVTVSYIGTSSGKDEVQARAFVTGMLAISDVSTVTWANPLVPGGGGTPSPFPPPSIGSVTPADGATVTTPVAIKATIDPPAGESITDWKVTYQRDGTTGATQIASGTGAPPATLATFDPTVLPNGTYLIAITANASNGGFQTSTTNLVVDGNLKLGRYATTYQDLDVSLGALPLRILRSYDSFDKSVGDFGVGWRVEIANFRVSTGRPLGQGGWTMYNKQCFFGLCITGFTSSVPHIATVTWPDGHQESFDFTPGGGTNIFWTGTAAFTGRGRATSTLEVDGSNEISFIGDGNIYAGGFGSGTMFDPQRFRLTAKDGTTYLLDRTTGLVSAQDRNGNMLTVTPDGVTSSLGPSISFHRDSTHRIDSITGPSGETLTYAYSAGNLVSFIDAAHTLISYGYDAQHNLLTTSDPAGHPIRTVTYEDGRVSSVTDGTGKTITLTPSVADRQQVIGDPNNRLTTIFSYDDFGDTVQIDQVFDAQTLTTTMNYDPLGRLVKQTDPDGHDTEFTRDADGNITQLRDRAGKVTTYTYNRFGDVESVSTGGQTVVNVDYDTHGNAMTVRRAGGFGDYHYTYTATGLPLTLKDPAGRTESIGYDSNGFPNLLTDPSTNQTHLTNDASGHVLSVVDATSGSAAFTYDGNGNLLSITDGNIHTRSFTYDFRGNLVTETDPLHHTSTNEYDNAGHLVRRVDRANRETTFTYDADGHVASRTMPGGDVTTYVYDPLGRLIGANNNARQIVIQRDELGRLTNETDTGTAAAPMPSTEIAIAYDADSRRISSSGPDGAIGYAYDSQSRLKTLTDQAGEAFNFTFDAASRLTSLTRPNGVDDALTFDASDVVLSIVSTLGAATVASSTYGYDPQGQRSSATDLVGTSTFGHDASGRLTGASYPGGTFPSAAYAYDHAGNRTTGGATFDDANRLTSNVSFSYTYDAEGELVARHDIASGATTTFDWNAAHQLTAVHLPGGSTTTYRYDALGRRVELAHGGVRTSYVYDGNKIRLEYDSAGHVAASYTTGMPDDSVLEMTRAGQRYFYLTDAQGSTVALTNEAGAVVSTYRYDAFGNQTSTGTVENPFTFQGREFDSASGLYYFRARYYDPAAGRFVSEDPLEGANQYAFAANDPVDFGDPTGQSESAEYGLVVSSAVTEAEALGAAVDLVEAGVPVAATEADLAALGDTVVQSFEGPISKMLLERNLLAFRFFPEGFSALGRWLTTLGTALRIGDFGKPAIDALNLLVSGNPATGLAPILLPAGTTVYFGQIAGSTMPGAVQIFIQTVTGIVLAP